MIAYAALELSDQGIKSQVVDVVTSVLFAPEDPSAMLKVMTDETTRIVRSYHYEKKDTVGAREIRRLILVSRYQT